MSEGAHFLVILNKNSVRPAHLFTGVQVASWFEKLRISSNSHDFTHSVDQAGITTHKRSQASLEEKKKPTIQCFFKYSSTVYHSIILVRPLPSAHAVGVSGDTSLKLVYRCRL